MAESDRLESDCLARDRRFESCSFRQNLLGFYMRQILARSLQKFCIEKFLEDPPYRNKAKMHYLYILLNEAKTRTYTGVADDVNKRLAVHNAGKVKASRPYRLYNIIHTESFETLKAARQKEKFYKSTTGRRRLKEMFFKSNLPSTA